MWRLFTLEEEDTADGTGIAIVEFNVPRDALPVILETILWVRRPNQQCHSTEGQWLVNHDKGQSHEAQLTKR